MKMVKAIRYEQGIPQTVNDCLVEENMLHISINGAPYTVTMCSPNNEADLVHGILITEAVCLPGAQPIIQAIEKNEEGIVVKIDACIPTNQLGSGFLVKRNLLSVSSCGLCGQVDARTELLGDSLPLVSSFSPQQILSFFETMRAHQTNFQQTGGSHAAAAFDETGQCLVLREDIGRHNAVDKVIGALFQMEQLHRAACLLVSGRVSFEIVSKCFRAGIPRLAAVSAPSSLAVVYCQEKNIQLYGFCRKERITCYTPKDVSH
ncbi:MAG: formate dehydrogenase accessory sulfurtransferase FdhD [Chitinophagaceae bacterium]|nr:formate dehydrogenase accessory sulfurtransferase FdhD [Chitinophagaceae bacterium]